MRLIDADELKEKAFSDPDTTMSGEALVYVQDIDEAPTVEAVPVVRCGECEKRNKSADLTYTIYCPWLGQQMGKTDFCSYGERKENNHD